MSKYIQKALRKKVIDRAKGLCEYCLIPKAYTTKSFEIEHILPTSKNGKTLLGNLAYSCGGCNSFKNTKTEMLDPYNEKLVSLFNPRTQVWFDHFTWNENFLLIIGITAVGRATVSGLKMNREELVNLRRLLRRVGKHPPFFKAP